MGFHAELLPERYWEGLRLQMVVVVVGRREGVEGVGGGDFIAGGNWSLTRATAHDDDEGQTFKETQAQNAVFTEGWVFFYEG